MLPPCRTIFNRMNFESLTRMQSVRGRIGYNEPMRVVALDIGEKNIGVAMSDPTGTISRPCRRIVRTSLKKDLEALQRLVREGEADILVVGLPRNMDGTVGSQAKRVERVIQSLRTLGVPVYKVDERLSSREAEQRMVEAGLGIKERNLRRDEFAAAVILQRYLEEGPI
ncbi:MAG: Holliday junction resolvase RuvX [Acidobacteria bacterium]|nr:Holliday junction resolvase RuvX [Acidobacteriota bacterium]